MSYTNRRLPLPFITLFNEQTTNKRETYWNNHWIFMSRMSFLPLNYSVKALQENPVVWSSFVLQTWYQHPIDTLANKQKV